MSARPQLDSLAALFQPEGGLEGMVAHGQAESTDSVSAASLFARAATIAAHLPDATPGSEVAFSFGYDQVGFAAALLATWSRGHTAALPEDEHRDNIIPVLAREENAAFLHDTGVGLGIHVPSLLDARLDEDTVLPWPTSFDVGRPALIAFRQAAVEEARSWSCTAAELTECVDQLVGSLDLTAGGGMASSLTPSSIPGLLVGILAPLRHGGTFATRTSRPGEPDFGAVEEASMWLGSPAHARMLARGSNTTTRFETLYVADGGADASTTNALAQGAAVRVVPLADLPLDDELGPEVRTLEAALHGSGATKDAAVASREVDGHAKIFVAIELEESAELAPLRGLAEELLPDGSAFELGAFPSLPRNENGRLPDWRIALDFGIGRHGHALETQLAWTRTSESSEDSYRFRTRLPEHYAFFEGHYTGYPILAGAVQLHELVLPCIREVAPEVGVITKLTGLKFMSRIAPGDEVEVVLRQSSPSDYRFDIESGGTRCSAGQIRFASGEEATP